VVSARLVYSGEDDRIGEAMLSFVTEETMKYKIRELRDEAERIGARWSRIDDQAKLEPATVKPHAESLIREEVTR
jgi:hypothetical protein